jgi:hypothetical protein
LLAKFGSVKNFRIYFAGQPLGLSPDAEASILSHAFKDKALWYILNKDEMANFISDFLQKTGLKIQREGLSKEASEYIAVLDIQDPEYLFILKITPASEVGKINLFGYRITIAEPSYLKVVLDGSTPSYYYYFNQNIVKGFYSFDDPAGFGIHIEDMASKAKKMVEFARGIEKTFTSEFGEASYQRTDGIYVSPEVGQGKYVVGLSKTLSKGGISLKAYIKPDEISIEFHKYEHMNMKIFHNQEKEIIESLGYTYRNKSKGIVVFSKSFKHPFPADDPAKGAEEIMKDILNEYRNMINMVIDARKSIKRERVKAKKYRSTPVTIEREEVARAFWLEVMRILLAKSYIYWHIVYINNINIDTIIDKIYESMSAKDKQYVYILSKKLGVEHKVDKKLSLSYWNIDNYGEKLLDKLISTSAFTLGRVNNKVNICVFGKAFDLQSILSNMGINVNTREVLAAIISTYMAIHIDKGRIDKLFQELVGLGLPEKTAASAIADRALPFIDSLVNRYSVIYRDTFTKILLDTSIAGKPLVAFVKKDIDTLRKLTRYGNLFNKTNDIYKAMLRFIDIEEKAKLLRDVIRCEIEGHSQDCKFILYPLHRALVELEPEAFLGNLKNKAADLNYILPPEIPALPFIWILSDGGDIFAMILDIEPSGSIHESPKVFGILYGSYLVPVKARNLEEISRIGWRGIIDTWNRIKRVLDDEELGNLVSLIKYNSLEIPVVSIGAEDRLVFLTEDMIDYIKKLKTLGRYTVYV